MKGCCGVTVKYLVFLTNLLVFLAGCVALGYGIYALASDGDGDDVVVITGGGYRYDLDDGGQSKLPEVVLVVASAVVVILTFLGCCGALRESRVAIFLYFLILLILSLAAVAAATIAFGRSVEEMREPLLRSMSSYRNDRANFSRWSAKEAAITKNWDAVQMQFGCCGVDGFSDWAERDPGQFPGAGGQVVPASCCDPGFERMREIVQEEKLKNMILTDVQKLRNQTESYVSSCVKRPFEEAYSDRTEGCLTALMFATDNNDTQRIVGYASVAIILAMVLNLVVIFGFGLCLVPKSAYQQVE